MDQKEILENIGKIEIREGRERTIKSYVLRNNILEDKEKDAVVKYMPHYGLFFKDEMLDYSAIFSNDNPTIIEIGFGNGETTAKMALIKPENNYIGLEVYLKGFVQLLKTLGENDIDNVRIMNPSFLHLLATKLKKGGYIYMVTDWQEYADEVLELVKDEPLLMNPFYTFAPPVTWRPLTKFEQKGMDKDYVINEIWFERKK